MFPAIMRLLPAQRIQYYLCSLFSLLLVLLLQTSATGIVVDYPLEPPDTSSPQATLRSFVDNVNTSHEALMAAYTQYLEEPGLFASASVRQQAKVARVFFDRAARCLNLSEIPDSLISDAATEKTLRLKEILDRIETPYYSDIPDASEIDDISSWRIPKTEIEITEVQEGERIGEFLFSVETVKNLSEFYNKVEALPYKPGATVGFYDFYASTPGSLLPPKWFRWLPSGLNAVYWEQTLWQWIGMGITLLLTFAIVTITFYWNQNRSVDFNKVQKYFVRIQSPLIGILLLSVAANFIDNQLNVTGTVLLFVVTGLSFILWFLAALLSFLLNNMLGEISIHYMHINQHRVDTNLIRVFVQLVSCVIFAAVLIFGMQRLGINLLPIIAGLGIGGLAIALGAQSTLENMIAGLALFFDQPVTVGDLCVFGEQEGIVEAIGLRSIRLRGIDGTSISMPNSAFSQLELVNKSRCDKLLFKHIINLANETTSEQLQFSLIKFRGILMEYPQVLDHPLHVRWIGYGEGSIDVEIFAYIETGNKEIFLNIQEELLMKIKVILEELEITLAVPC